MKFILKLLVLGLSVLASNLTSPLHASNRPNILFIVVDDLLPMLGAYGYPLIQSPNIDRIAADGVLYQRAYAQQALCSPSRVSALTGMRPDRHFQVRAVQRMRTLDPDTVSLPQYLRQHGYYTFGIGKVFDARTVVGVDDVSWTSFLRSHEIKYSEVTGAPANHYQAPEIKKIYANAPNLSGNESMRYFRERNARPATEALDVPDDAYFDGAITLHAIEKLRSHVAKNEGQPLFLAVGYIRPHLPFVAPKRYWDLYNERDFEIARFQDYPENSPPVAHSSYHELLDYNVAENRSPFSPEYQRHLKHGYAASVSYVDAQVGLLLDELKNLGLGDDTIIVLWGDHGFHLGDKGFWGKHTNYEEATWAPLIFKAPGLKGGEQIDEPVELLDIFPTLVHLVGLPLPGNLDGKILVPFVEPSDDGKLRVAQSQYERRGAMGYSIRSSAYRYVEWREAGIQRRSVDEVTGTIIARELYYYGENNSGPGEALNLAGDPSYAGIVEIMSTRLAEVLSYLPTVTREIIVPQLPKSEENDIRIVRATEAGDLETVKYLLKAGSHINSYEPTRRRNLLRIAVENNDLALLTLLLEAGACMYQTDNWGETAWTRAQRNTQSPVFETLQTYNQLLGQ